MKRFVSLSIYIAIVLCVLFTACSVKGYQTQTFEVPDTIIDSVDIERFVRATYEIGDEYSIVNYTATIDVNHSGRWDITFAQKGKKRPGFIIVAVDTQENTAFDFHTASYDSKLNKQHYLDDCISSEEAIAIAQKETSTTFYSRIRLTIKNQIGQEYPIWNVVFDDSRFVDINAKNGEVVFVEK